jgi:hypothetical protein
MLHATIDGANSEKNHPKFERYIYFDLANSRYNKFTKYVILSKTKPYANCDKEMACHASWICIYGSGIILDIE